MKVLTWIIRAVRAVFSFSPSGEAGAGFRFSRVAAAAFAVLLVLPVATEPAFAQETPCVQGEDDSNDENCQPDEAAASSSGSSAIGGIFIGGAALFALYALGSADDASGFSVSPDAGYSIDESGYVYNYGGRADFRKDNLHLYWTAGQGGADGDFRYAGGLNYEGDFWTAAFSERVQGETLDYDLSLAAKYDGGLWQMSPVYRLHSRFDEGGAESETNNSLNLEAILRAERWTIRPTAGFRWQSADEFGDNARFSVSAVRNF